MQQIGEQKELVDAEPIRRILDRLRKCSEGCGAEKIRRRGHDMLVMEIGQQQASEIQQLGSKTWRLLGDLVQQADDILLSRTARASPSEEEGAPQAVEAQARIA